MDEVVCIIGPGCTQRCDGLIQCEELIESEELMPPYSVSVPLEILNLALVLLCFLERVEGSQVAGVAGGRILLTRIQAELAGFEFSYHGEVSRVFRTLLLPQGFSKYTDRKWLVLNQRDPLLGNSQSHRASDLIKEQGV